MCTLTAVPTAGGVRVAFNRDEQRSRPPARPPEVVRAGLRQAVCPTDPPSGGTWLAATDAGLVLAVLNVTRPGRPPAAGRVSRGWVVPALLACESPWDAVFRLQRALDLADLAPFRLVAVGPGGVTDLLWDGRSATIAARPCGPRPVLFTSSGLGDERAEAARRPLFRRMTDCPPPAWPAAQDAFHRHRWPDRPEVSVNMCRADARTVSHAVVAVGAGEVVLTYHPDAPDRPTEAVTVSLALTPAGDA